MKRSSEDMLKKQSKQNKVRSFNKDNIICFLTSFVFIFVGYSLFLNDTANYDHMDMYDNISSYPFVDFTRAMSYGRVILFFFNKIYKLFALVGVTKLHNEWVIQLLFMFVLAYAVTVLYRCFEGHFVLKHKHVILPLVISFGFVNPFFVDNLVYVALEYGFAMLLIAWAVEACDKNKWWLAGILTFLSISIYQSYYILLFIWGSMLIFLKYRGVFQVKAAEKGAKTALRDYIYLALSGLIPAILNVLSVKVFLHFVDAEDMKSVSMFGSEGQSFIVYIFSALYHSFDTMFSLAPKFYLGIVLVVLCAIIGLYMIANRQNIGRIIYVIVFCVAQVMFTFTIFATGYTDIVPRVLFTVFAGVSMIALVGLYLMSEDGKTKAEERVWSGWLKATILILAVVGLSDIVITQTCCTDYYIAIQHDAQMVGTIQDYIRDYEEQSGNSVTTIATSQFKYLERQNKHQIMDGEFPNYIQKSAHAHWCRADMINFFCGTSYVDEFISDEQYNEFFADKEATWTEFNPDEQLVFEGNTVYWAVY